MNRKLVKQGANALTLTLPREWIKQNNLKPGDEVFIDMRQESLVVSIGESSNVKSIDVDVSGLLPKLADRFMARAYQKGYDKISIRFDDPQIMYAIKNKVPELMGFEILNVTKNKMDIQIVSNNLNLDFDVLLRRAFLILLDMGNTCESAWKASDSSSLESIFLQDYDVNKFLYFCLRTMNTSHRVVSFGRSIEYYLIENLEDLGDELKSIGRLLAKEKRDGDILKIITLLNEMFKTSYEFYYKPQTKKATDAFTKGEKISKLIHDQLGKKNKGLSEVLMRLELAKRIVYHLVTMRLDTLRELSGNK